MFYFHIKSPYVVYNFVIASSCYNEPSLNKLWIGRIENFIFQLLYRWNDEFLKKKKKNFFPKGIVGITRRIYRFIYVIAFSYVKYEFHYATRL